MTAVAAIKHDTRVHLTTTRGDLLPMLTALKRITQGARRLMPIFEYVVFDGEEGSIWATDYETTLKFDVGVGGGKALVRLEELLTAVKNGARGRSKAALTCPVEVVIAADAGLVRVGALQVPLMVTTDLSNYPGRPSLEPVDFVATTCAGSLREMWAGAVWAVGREMHVPVLTGVHVTTEAMIDRATLVATDRYRLARVHHGLGCARDWSGLIPTTLTPYLVLLGEDDQSVTMSTADVRDSLLIRGGNTTIHTRLLDGDYPKTDSIWPTTWHRSHTVDRDALIQAVKQVDGFVGKNQPVVLEFLGGAVTVSTTPTETGVIAAPPVTCTTDVEDAENEAFKAGYNPGFLLDALGALPAGPVQIEHTEANKPARIHKDGHFVDSILMPTRIAS